MMQYHFTASYEDVEYISDKLKEHYFPEGTSIEENPKKAVDVSRIIKLTTRLKKTLICY